MAVPNDTKPQAKYHQSSHKALSQAHALTTTVGLLNKSAHGSHGAVGEGISENFPLSTEKLARSKRKRVSQ